MFDSKTLCVETRLLPKLLQTQGKERHREGADQSRVPGPASLTSKMRSHPRSLPSPFLRLGDQLSWGCLPGPRPLDLIYQALPSPPLGPAVHCLGTAEGKRVGHLCGPSAL